MTNLFKKPKPPPAPDYAALAQQQGQANEQSAITTAKLGSPNEETPWGSISRTYDPATKQFTYSTQLTEDQQRLLDGSEEIDLAKMDLGKQQVGNLSELWSQPFSTEGMTERVTNVTPSNLQTSFAKANYQFDPGQASSYQKSVQGTDVQGSVSGQGYNFDLGESGSYRAALDLGKLGNRPTLDFSGLPTMPGVNDFGSERQRVEDALYQQQSTRLDPEWKQREEQLRNQLYSQGIREGNPAWTQAFNEFNRSRDESYQGARLSSITGGGAEQSRLFDMASTARNQMAQEALAAAGFDVDARSQGVAEALAAGNFENAVVQLERQYGLDRNAAINQATQLQNAFNLAQGEFANNASAQQFSQNVTQGNFANTVTQLERQYGLDRQQAENLARQMQNELEMQGAAFNNTAEGQRFDEDMANALLANQSRGQELDEAAFERRLPFEEFSAITSGTQVQSPQFGGPTVTPGVEAAPVYQAGQDQYQANYNVWLQKMNQLNETWKNISNIASSFAG